MFRYNERRSSSLLSVLVSLPMTTSTVFVRLAALIVILSFQSTRNSLILLAIITLLNLVLGLVAKVGGGRGGGEGGKREEEEEGGVPAVLDCLGKRGSALLSTLLGLIMKYSQSVLIYPFSCHNPSTLFHDGFYFRSLLVGIEK